MYPYVIKSMVSMLSDVKFTVNQANDRAVKLQANKGQLSAVGLRIISPRQPRPRSSRAITSVAPYNSVRWELNMHCVLIV